MSGFSTDWLRLREPADHKARSEPLVRDLLTYLGERDAVSVLDLGCGTGSNLRALAPLLPMPQHWALVDYDRALLDAARLEIESWLPGADVAEMTYHLQAADLTTDLDQLFNVNAYDLITAAALFDLVSEDWIKDFVAQLAARSCAFYTVLIYDGEMSWTPAHSADDDIRAAFNAHQQSDKGFGAAAGPRAGTVLAACLKDAGFKVRTEQSPWLLGPSEKPLMQATADGIGKAAEESGLMDDVALTSWRTSRSALERCEIGHTDILAIPA